MWNCSVDSKIWSGAIWVRTTCKACEERMPKLTIFWTYDHWHAWLHIHTWKFSGYACSRVSEFGVWNWLLELRGCGVHGSGCQGGDCKSLSVLFPSITEGPCVCSQWSSILSITLFWMQTLASCREKVCRELDIPEHECELSMGMSSDFENAVLSLFSLFFATSYGSI